MAKNTCGNTEKAQSDPINELEVWVRGMRKQGDLSRKAAAAAELALMIWAALTDEQRAELLTHDSVRCSIKNLIGYGYSWSV